MLRDLKRVNPKAWALAKDTSPYSAGLCPRRAGKSYTGALLALIMGLAKPGSISIIISLNLKQLKRLYWESGPSGLWTIARRYGIEITPHHSALKWTLPNGSIGYLMGAEDDDQLENLRGLEADLYLIDECKSFVPERLRTLITSIIEPQRASRDGRIILIGTPGYLKGPFWEATCPTARQEDKSRWSIAWEERHLATPQELEDLKEGILWSRHHWTLEENSAMPHQWAKALVTFRKNKWTEDNPIWQMEYLGKWVESGSGLVYKYLEALGRGLVHWVPEVSEANPTGLPPGDWRLIGGMDLGFNDKTALVILAYSKRFGELRHVYDFSAPHMVPDDVADLLAGVMARFAPMPLEMIYADTGNLGKMVVAQLVRKGFPIEAAEKREKFDHIELVNSALLRGEIKIISNSTLAHQLSTNAWDLRKGEFEQLAKIGRLREDDSVENDVADAFLYAFRASLHRFGQRDVQGPPIEEFSPAWLEKQHKEELAAVRKQLRQVDGLGKSPLATATGPVRAALNRSPLLQQGLQRSQWMRAGSRN